MDFFETQCRTVCYDDVDDEEENECICPSALMDSESYYIRRRREKKLYALLTASPTYMRVHGVAVMLSVASRLIDGHSQKGVAMY